MMRQYELMVVATPGLDLKDTKEQQDLVSKFLSSAKPQGLSIQSLGKKALAYSINKCNEGQYLLATFGSEKISIGELEKHKRLTGSILRYLLILREGHVVKKS